MHRKVIATQTGRYGTRMLTAGDELIVSGPAARTMIALGRATDAPKRRRRLAAPVDDIAELRTAYEVKLGKRPFNGWDAATLREKIAG